MKITDIIGTGNSVDKSVAMSGKDTVVGVNAQFTGNIMFSQNLKISGTVNILEMHGGATVNGSLIRNMGKTAGLIEKKIENDDKSTGFLQSIDKQEK